MKPNQLELELATLHATIKLLAKNPLLPTVARDAIVQAGGTIQALATIVLELRERVHTIAQLHALPRLAGVH